MEFAHRQLPSYVGEQVVLVINTLMGRLLLVLLDNWDEQWDGMARAVKHYISCGGGTLFQLLVHQPLTHGQKSAIENCKFYANSSESTIAATAIFSTHAHLLTLIQQLHQSQSIQ